MDPRPPTPVADLERASLNDKYTADQGWFYMTGMQALVRLPIQQHRRDQAQGLNTGGYISGYRGSPMGRYDMELWAADALLKQHNIVFRSGLNEDLAATAIWGAQYIGSFPGAKVDGVFGFWYGKGPGVDRSGDALRHANLAGTSPHGGVVCLAGDDHGAKSSTVANFSDQIFIAVGIPLLYPSNVQEILDYGLHGIAMSRYSGCWAGMKVVTDVVEGGGSVYVAPDSPAVTLPEPPSKPGDPFGNATTPSGYHIRSFDMALPQEDRLYHHKLFAVMAYARANGLNRITLNPPGTGADQAPARIGIVSAGKSWQDVLQAMTQLGLHDQKAAALGLRLLKIGLIWPLDPVIVREFARGLDVILVVEEKRPILEDQIRQVLYGTPHAPRLIGKYAAGSVFDPAHGPMVMPNAAELSPMLIAKVLSDLLHQTLGEQAQAAGVPQIDPPTGKAGPSGVPNRAPGFCSGCPHNRSTKVIEGSRALAGIGCHTMAMFVNPKVTTTTSHMGAEGVMWLGQQPFTAEQHVFANIGDGTYAHSGFLALRQAIIARVPMTYKILYNGFVSMTGGQTVEGNLSPAQMLHELAAEGVQRMAVVTDDPERYEGVTLPTGASLFHRSELDAAQKLLRDYSISSNSVTVLVYDQPCATERRRLRKRGKWADPDKRSFINAAVCEGCGDCGKASNCMSIEPLETDFGRKRRINQASCNKDFTCVEGFCPSFVTVSGAKLRKPTAIGLETPAAASASAADSPSANVVALPSLDASALPEPHTPTLDRAFSVLIGGIGGTGVVTIGQTVAMAAHLQGYFSTNLDVTGLSQKYGAVTSHVRIAPDPALLHATRIANGEADTLIGCDLIVAAGDEAFSKLHPARSHGVVCTDLIPTAEFARNPEWAVDTAALTDRLRGALGDRVLLLEGQKLATTLCGDPIAANMFLLGASWQLGQIPLSLQALNRAIELNGVAVALNKQAFAWGRRAALDLPAVEHLVADRRRAMGQASARESNTQVLQFVPRRHAKLPLADLIAQRSTQLVEHTGPALAQRFQQLVDRVRQAETAAVGSSSGDALTRAVAQAYHKLLAVKDPWEVARLYAHPDFRAALQREFDGPVTLHFHVGAWPFAKIDASTGKPVKSEVGPWLMTAFQWMSRFKRLRGTVLDPFRKDAERQLDRKLLAQYEADVQALLAGLGTASGAQTPAQRLELAAQIASWPDKVRGYGHVRQAQAEQALAHRATLWQRWEDRANSPMTSTVAVRVA